MAVEIGVAKGGYLNLLYQLREFLTGYRLIPNSDITFPGATNATLDNLRLAPTITEETITLECQDTGSGSATYPVAIVNGAFSGGAFTGWTAGFFPVTVSQVADIGVQYVAHGVSVESCNFQQTISLPAGAASGISAGKALLRFSWDQASAEGLDVAWVELQFLTAGDGDLGTTVSRKEAGFPYTLRSRTLNIKIPATAAKLRIHVFLKGYTTGAHTRAYVTNFVGNVVTDPLEFAMSGSVSGAIDTVFAHEDYNANDISFHLTPGAVSFTVSQEITFEALPNDLVVQAVDESWSISNADGEWNGKQYLLGTGLAGVDLIHIGILNNVSKTEDYYNLGFQGQIDYNDAENDNFTLQPGASTITYMQFWDLDIPYWFVADGRHFKIITKISTTMQSGYFGLILPYATPGQFPLPLYVCGTHPSANARWSLEAHTHRGMFDPFGNTGYLRKVDGSWLGFGNKSQSSGSLSTITVSNVHPWNSVTDLRNNIDGSYTLIQSSLISSDSLGNNYGILPGVFWISGFANSSEVVITIDTVDYLVIQNIYRTGFSDYCAIALE